MLPQVRAAADDLKLAAPSAIPPAMVASPKVKMSATAVAAKVASANSMASRMISLTRSSATWHSCAARLRVLAAVPMSLAIASSALTS